VTEDNIAPLAIVGVDTARVGTPRNDGSAGSALYRVPIMLSRTPTPDEARMLVSVWDRPPSYTTMHRPGIASVAGAAFVLDGTTIDEVADYHAKTLRLVVDRVNALASEERRRRSADAARAAEAKAAHASHVEDVAGRIRFD
jgi:hypothetical protein